MRHPYFDLPTPIPVGHRGASGERPENTLPAFRLALTQGAQILETDTHPTKDGVPVLLHDEALDRTTDGTGSVHDVTLEELQQLDAGHHFVAEDGRTFRGQGIRVPTLEEVLRELPEARLNIEIKSGDRSFVERVVRMVEDAGRSDVTLLTSARDDLIAELRAVLAETGVKTAVGASAGDCIAFVKAAASGEPPPAGVMALQIPDDFGGRPLVTPELLDFAHRHDVHVHVWTINEPAEIARLLDLGVDAVMSDHPVRVVEEIRRRAPDASEA